MGGTLPLGGRGHAMSWKECHVMDERLRFAARLLEGEKMAPLCAEFGIAGRPATRFRPLQGLRRRGLQRPQPAAAPPGQSAPYSDRGDDRPAETRIPRAGARPRSARSSGSNSTGPPAGDQHRPRRARSSQPGESIGPAAPVRPLSRPTEPNVLWCADYKGEFMLGIAGTAIR